MKNNGRALKYCDYHFGKDFCEVGLKIFCYALSGVVIWISMALMGTDDVDKSAALSMFVLVVSFGADFVELLMHRNKKKAKFITIIIIAILFVIGLYDFAVLMGAASTAYFHYCYKFYVFLIVWMCVDVAFILCDTEVPCELELDEGAKSSGITPEETSMRQNAFKINGKYSSLKPRQHVFRRRNKRF